MRLAGSCIPIAILTMACSGTGQPEIFYPAFMSAETPGEISAGAWTVTLDEARVAFGPVYFCAAASGSATLCETAIAEIARVSRFDALATMPQPLGDVRGFEGDVRSASYDYGIHWFLTESSPVADGAAPDGHSARFAGTARRGADTVAFVAEVDALAQFQGQRAVPSAPASASIRGERARLDVRFDVGAWLGGIDFDGAAEAGAATLAIKAGSRDHDAIVIAMVATHPPEFTWSGDDVTGTP